MGLCFGSNMVLIMLSPDKGNLTLIVVIVFAMVSNDLFQQPPNENSVGYQQKIENFYQENKAISQTFVGNLKDEISHLESEIEFLRSLVKS